MKIYFSLIFGDLVNVAQFNFKDGVHVISEDADITREVQFTAALYHCLHSRESKFNMKLIMMCI